MATALDRLLAALIAVAAVTPVAAEEAAART